MILLPRITDLEIEQAAMNDSSPTATRLAPQPMPANITSVQPGGGTLAALEQWWGRWRRRGLRRFRPKYVQRMRSLRKGSCDACPHDVIDSRDLKLYRNVCGYWFDAGDDPFRWRQRIPLAREAFAEATLLGAPLLFATLLAAGTPWWYVSALPATMAFALLWFFRDPARMIPTSPGCVVSPADGTVVDIEKFDHDEFLEGPAVKIGIFLSLMNVHVNRSPLPARVIALQYRPGKFWAAMRREAAEENERLTLWLEEEAWPHRRMIVRQIAGFVARRIVCTLRTGQTLARGEKIGLIKLGSRTELVLPMEERLELMVLVGMRVKGGTTILARYLEEGSTT